jgi:16S rRNA (uracil1498-N3)-methyltransferase
MRIFVEPAALVAGTLVIRGDEHHYLGRARRAAVGDKLEIYDGAGHRAMADIVAMTDDATTLHVYAPDSIPSKQPWVRVLLPLIKGDRMDTALEKLVEVGADEILVWPAARSVVKLEADRRDARVEKYQLAVQAAARQSGRAQVPPVRWIELATAIANLAHTKLVLDPNSTTPLPETVRPGTYEEHALEEVTLVSGPEGGFAPAELLALAVAGFTPVGLGPRVLRAETAPVVAVSIVRALTRS